MKVLIAEDNDDSRRLLTKQLQAFGHEVTATADGAEALKHALAQCPDVIVSDIMMPVVDGFQLCYTCKQSEDLKDIPFVFYTATYLSEEDEKFAMELGVDAFIRKPTDPASLVQQLLETFENPKSRSSSPTKRPPLEISNYLTEYSKRIVSKLEEKMAELENEISAHARAENDLRERVKELKCLYGTARILEKADLALDEMYQQLVDILPSGWQYPQITYARILIDGKAFETPNYQDTEWKLFSDIKTLGAKGGGIPDRGEEPD